MIIHKCDRCGCEMFELVEVQTNGKYVGSNPLHNVYPLLKYSGSHEYCISCWDDLLVELTRKRVESD